MNLNNQSPDQAPSQTAGRTELRRAELVPSSSDTESSSKDPDLREFMAYARTLFMPLIVTKSFIMYFGLNYSMYPGEGYGYGLAASIIVSIANLSFFIWRQSRR